MDWLPSVLGSFHWRSITGAVCIRQYDVTSNTLGIKLMSIKVKRSRAQPIAQLLTKSGGVGQLMRQSRLIDQAQRHLRAHLPEEMREHIFATN